MRRSLLIDVHLSSVETFSGAVRDDRQPLFSRQTDDDADVLTTASPLHPQVPRSWPPFLISTWPTLST